MPDAILGGTKAQASLPLGAVVIELGADCTAWIMPSFEPNKTNVRRLAWAVRNASTLSLSDAVAWRYQDGNPGGDSTAGVEVSIEPSRLWAMLALPTPKRALRTQLITLLAWVASVTARVDCRLLLLALPVVKSSRVVPLVVAV
ncbi:MAG: hypothetical protein R3B06_11355 [Kofleriaceae bacterium]